MVEIQNNNHAVAAAATTALAEMQNQCALKCPEKSIPPNTLMSYPR
jgi:hypothetical protein